MSIPEKLFLDFRALFESSPGLFLVVLPDNDFTAVAVTEAYLQATHTRREHIVGEGLFKVLADGPGEPAVAAVQALCSSLERVRQTRVPDAIVVQEYGFGRADGPTGGFMEHTWRSLNSPVLSADGELLYIIHRVEKMTEQAQAERELAEEALYESEERLRMAVESANLGTWDYNLRNGEVVWSDQCKRIFGFPPETLITYPLFLERVHPEDRARVETDVQRTLSPGGGTLDTEYRVIRYPKNGIRCVIARGRAYFDPSGQRPQRMVGTVLDITERKRAEEAALRRTAQLQELAAVSTRLNAAHDVPSVLGIITEEARNLIGARQACTSVLRDRPGLEPTTVISHSGKDGPGSTYDELPAVSGIATLAECTQGPVRITRADLETHPMLRGLEPQVVDHLLENGVLAVPLIGRNAKNLGVVQLSDKVGGEFCEDDEALLSQLAQIASGAIENARLYQELRENDQRKDEFLAMLAHELRNPLAAIGNAVNLGSGSSDAEEVEWSMEVINRQLRHLTRLIDDLLDVSRITRGKIQLRKERVDGALILDTAVEAVRPLVEERHHKLTVSFRPGTLFLEADPTRLEQILVNLLTNAAKYTESGGQIVLRANHEGGEIVFSVRDNGVGIPAEKLPGMFELFAQGDRSLARSEGGLGIGLTLVRSLAEMHGGSVSAMSEGLGKGSEFVVRLPAASAGLAPYRSPLLFAAKEQSALPNAPRRILVVDDNVDSAHGTARLLSRRGHEVRTAHDGPSALEAAREFLPEFVLLDIGLPGMDGYQVASRLRGERDLSEIVIIAVTGYGQEEDQRRSRAAGFDYHLVKPIDHDALLKSVTLRPRR